MALGLASCGGAAGEALRPNDHTATGALGSGAVKCSESPKYAKPLIVDLDPDARVDLEAAMKKGVVVVAYDCSSLRVLTGCKLPDSSYEYAGVSRKEQVVQMKSMDDVNVNLPLSSAKLSGEMQSGRTIDLALVLVGRNSTTVAKVELHDLQGTCDGATHFVQNASVGAFSMATGSVGKVAAVAEMFDKGGSAKSESERKSMSMDGSLDACRSSDPDAASPPSECRAPLRVELQPIGGQPEAETKPKSKPGKEDDKDKSANAQENPCPTGYAFANGICTKAADVPTVCNPKNEADCKTQCSKGSGESCYNYGRILAKQRKWDAAAPEFKKACDADVPDGCAEYGRNLMPDTDLPGVAEKSKESLIVLAKACKMGSAFGCELMGDLLEDASYKIMDKAIAAKAYDRGCSLGRGMSCWSLAMMYFEGNGVPKNADKGVALLSKACQAGSADECNDLADVYTKGQYGVEKDLNMAFRANDRACDLDAGWCFSAIKSAQLLGKDKTAAEYALRACEKGQDAEACGILGDFYNGGKGVSKDPDKAKAFWTRGCQNGEGDENACKRIGVKMKD